MTMVLFTAVAIVRERERGNLELLINTPVSRAELMLGKIFPYIPIGLVHVTLILLLGHLLFGVPLRLYSVLPLVSRTFFAKRWADRIFTSDPVGSLAGTHSRVLAQ